MSDITTREDALKALHDIKTEQKRLADNDRVLRTEVVEKMATDIKSIQQQIAESAAPKVETVSEKEVTLRRFVKQDGSLDMEGLCTDTADRGEWHAEFKRLVDDRNLCRMLTKSGKGSTALDAKLNEHMGKAPAMIKRVFSDASSVGDDFVPDVYLPILGRKLYQPTDLEAALPSMTLTSKEVRLPFSSAAVAPYLKAAATWTSIGASDSTTDQISATAQSFAARITADEDTAADSFVPALEYFRQELATAIASGVEDAIVNGDTAATHADINTTGSARVWSGGGRWDTSTVTSVASDHRRSFIGFRAAAVDASTTRDANAMTYADILATRSTLGGGYQAANDLLMVVSPIVMVKYLVQLAETKTLDVFGPQAGVLQGSIAKLGGMDIMISGFMTDDLNASGAYDGSTTTKTGYCIVHRPSWHMANYKAHTVDVDREITKGQIEIVATRRSVLVDMSKGNKSVAFGYNVAK
jgi:hypothetical protein